MENALCGRCSEPLDTTGSPNWCKACRSKYQQDYQETRRQMAKGKGYAEGVEALRELLVREFARLGTAQFSGYDCARIIKGVPQPR